MKKRSKAAPKDKDELTELLDRPAGEAVRRLALAELERAVEARGVLGATDEPDALHDFRVALRRLRSQLRAFREELRPTVPRKLVRRLRRLAAASGPERDAQVGLDWLDRLGKPDTPHQAVGWQRARARLEVHQAEGEARGELIERFDRLAGPLEERLSAWRIDLRPGSAPESFRSLVARELEAHHVALREGFDAIHELSDQVETHRTRIRVKRVRYLLDPLAAQLPAAKPLLALLRALQDLLGGLNDLAVLAGKVGAFSAELERAAFAAIAAGAPPRRARPRERAGLLALAEKIATARTERWREFSAGWLGSSAPARAELDSELASTVAALKS